MLVLIRTDRAVFLVHSSDPKCPRPGRGWIEVDGPVEGCLTLKMRPISAAEFVECVALSKLRAQTLCERHGLDPNKVVEVEINKAGKEVVTTLGGRLERTSLFGLCAKAAVVDVYGDDLPASVKLAPGSIVDMLDTDPATGLGNWVLDVSLNAPDPFVSGASA